MVGFTIDVRTIYNSRVFPKLMIRSSRTFQTLAALACVLVAQSARAAVPPTVAELTSPRHYSGTQQPAYTWVANPMATWYYLNVDYGSGANHYQWFTAQQANCAGGTGTCRATPPLSLPAGVARWRVRTWNSAGYGTWSDYFEFETALPSVHVLETYRVNDVRPGYPAQLWLHVGNSGARPLPAGAAAWSWVSGSGLGTYGSGADVAGIPAGATRWVLANWEVPIGRSAGTHQYRGNVWFAGRWVGSWTADRSFNVVAPLATSARVMRTWPIDNVVPGAPIRMWALVRNTGSTPLNARVWFNVYTRNWTGSAAIAGLSPGAEAWYSFAWTLPATAPPLTHWYLAQVWDTAGTRNLSDTSGWQAFNVGFISDFVNGFDGWSSRGGSWSHDAGLQALVVPSWGVLAYTGNYGLTSLDVTATLECTGAQEYSLLVRHNYLYEEGRFPPDFETHWFRVHDGRQFSVRTNAANGHGGEHQSPTFSSAINATGINVLRVVANGSAFAFLINGTQVWSGVDNAIPRGALQLFAAPGDGGTCTVYSIRGTGLSDPNMR